VFVTYGHNALTIQWPRLTAKKKTVKFFLSEGKIMEGFALNYTFWSFSSFPGKEAVSNRKWKQDPKDCLVVVVFKDQSFLFVIHLKIKNSIQLLWKIEIKKSIKCHI